MVSQRRWMLGAAVVLLPLSTGCNLISLPYVLFGPEPTEKVQAEFSHLKGKRVVVLVWAEQATLYEYPHVQVEVAGYVHYHLKEQIKPLDIVPPSQVKRYMQSHPDWATEHPGRIGRHFKADIAMMIELMEFTTREPGSPNLFRGRARAGITVYDLTGDQELPKGIALKPAEAVYPSDRPIGVLRADDRQIRAETYHELGRTVARKFYDHEVKR